MYYTYVLKSKKDGKFYVGVTKDLRRRFVEHNKGLVGATRHRRPLILVYYEACLDEKDAVKREKYFKTGFGRRFLKNRLENYLRLGEADGSFECEHEHWLPLLPVLFIHAGQIPSPQAVRDRAKRLQI